MPFRSAQLLQFADLKELLAGFAGSAAGKARVLAIDTHATRAAAESELQDAAEAIAYLNEAAGSPKAGSLKVGAALARLRFDQVRDIGGVVPLLRVQGTRLEGLELLDLFATLAIAGEYRAVLLAVADRYPRLATQARQLTDLRGFVGQYQRVILPDGNLTDDASPELRRIRRDIGRQQKNIHDSLDRFLQVHRADGTLQEDFITIREDRYVVPVVAGQKGRVDGIIHGASGTGRTLYLEPLETIGLNNQLVRLREDELQEIDRILLKITDELREHAGEILPSIEALTELDLLFAKGNFAMAYRAVIPRFSGDAQRRLILRDARHPLLETVLRAQRRTVVPISLELDSANRLLLISGPNTGGKTVTLKTCGLLIAMAHAALPVPCAEAEIPWLDDMLADIGDTQSIAENLSTFSGHLLRVREMLDAATPDSLVLLDELGGSTDPDEGGALGVAILDRFRRMGAFCMASTHLLPLKLYGTNTPGVVNASMGFDEHTLQPTYRLRLGIPGKSAGLDIASRLDMPADIIAHARGVMPRMQADFQDLLGRLQTQLEDVQKQTAQLTRDQQALANERAQLQEQSARREEKRVKEWERKREELIADFEARAMETITQVRETNESRKAAEQATLQVSKTRREFREQASVAMQSAAKPTAPAERAPLAEGTRVRIRDVSEPATVRRILKNGAIEVEAGFLKLQISPDDIVEVVTGSAARKLPKNVTLHSGPAFETSYKEINLIGQRAEEAREELDKFLDSAALASINRVRIVHGHGMGVLKRMVSDLLTSSPHVARSYPASPAEGGAGATIAELRE